MLCMPLTVSCNICSQELDIAMLTYYQVHPYNTPSKHINKHHTTKRYTHLENSNLYRWRWSRLLQDTSCILTSCWYELWTENNALWMPKDDQRYYDKSTPPPLPMISFGQVKKFGILMLFLTGVGCSKRFFMMLACLPDSLILSAPSCS